MWYKYLLSIVLLSLLVCNVSWAGNPLIGISAQNGYVLTYLKTTSTYMLSTTRIFNRPTGTTINCYAESASIYLEAIPLAGYEFDYWTGTAPLTGRSTMFVLPPEGARFTAHFKEITEQELCPICPVCVECPIPDPCPPCPECIIPPCPEAPPCPEVVKCPEIPPCPECPDPEPCVIPPCPVCPKVKSDGGMCFIDVIKNY